MDEASGSRGCCPTRRAGHEHNQPTWIAIESAWHPKGLQLLRKRGGAQLLSHA